MKYADKFLFNGKQPHELDRAEIKEAFAILKQASNSLTQREATKFYKGQRVFFEMNKFPFSKHEGTVLKINQKSIGVDVDTTDGEKREHPQQWKVSPGLLTAVEK